jgi:hypothetical protein
MEQIKQRRDEQAWREVLSRFASSAQTVSAFCEGEGISEASLYRWRSILQGAGRNKKSKQRASMVLSDARPSAAPFVDLGALRSDSARMEVRLDLGGGVWLTVVR